VAAPASIRCIDDGNFSSHITFRTKTAGSASNADVERMRIDSTGSAWIKTSRAWNDAVPTLNIGNDGDGRLQVRHIWGKSSGSTSSEHLWLQHGNGASQVQIGNVGQGSNLYVGGDIAVGAYFSTGTAGITASNGYVYAKRYTNIDGVSADTSFGLFFNGATDTGYAIYREAGAWTSPFPDLRIGFHTGIKIGANATYNGIKFYTDFDMGTQVMSINNSADPLGAANVYVNNSLQAGSSLRAPIFYDSQDTNFYCDPNGTSRFSTLIITSENLYVGDGVTNSFVRMRDSDEGERILHCNSNRIGFLNQAGAWGSWCEDDGAWATDFAMYAPIYYDRNNTGYYLNPDSTSNLNRVNAIGWDTTGRNYSREWIEFTNHSGLYSPLNGAHFYPNNASYGPWRIAGTRNGWAGLEFDSTGAGQISLMMNSGQTGVHNNTYSWQWYWTGGTFYVSKSTYGGGTIATVLDSSNYNSYAPTLTGGNASGTWGISITGNSSTTSQTNFSNLTINSSQVLHVGNISSNLNINQIGKVGHAGFGFEAGTFYQDYVRGTITSISRVAEGRYAVNGTLGSIVATSQNFHTVFVWSVTEVRVYSSANALIDSRYVQIVNLGI
jgi:hypothetical protein